ncbi:MAG: helix-turn-helix domain-containing protein [Armatimonadetes bacterium]|nr:helix-turn-helix domain-containing protein [Armatimonadota bacterium]
MQTLFRAVQLLALLESNPRGEGTLSGLARASGLPPSTAHRVLKALQGGRWLPLEWTDATRPHAGRTASAMAVI